MKFQVFRTDKFDEQLREIIYYIADSSQDINLALTQLQRLEKAIERLEEFPNSGSIPHYSSLKRRGYRVLIIEKYLIFYKVDLEKEIVYLYSVFNSRQEYLNLID